MKLTPGTINWANKKPMAGQVRDPRGEPNLLFCQRDISNKPFPKFYSPKYSAQPPPKKL